MNTQTATTELPPIPDKRYFTIGEVAVLCDLEQHVLRYWEEEFPSLVPSRRGNRRYYQRSDIELIRKIRHLLYDQRFTLAGARAQLKRGGTSVKPGIADAIQQSMQNAVQQLEGLLLDLQSQT